MEESFREVSKSFRRQIFMVIENNLFVSKEEKEQRVIRKIVVFEGEVKRQVWGQFVFLVMYFEARLVRIFFYFVVVGFRCVYFDGQRVLQVIGWRDMCRFVSEGGNYWLSTMFVLILRFVIVIVFIFFNKGR